MARPAVRWMSLMGVNGWPQPMLACKHCGPAMDKKTRHPVEVYLCLASDCKLQQGVAIQRMYLVIFADDILKTVNLSCHSGRDKHPADGEAFWAQFCWWRRPKLQQLKM
eukprot:scaffold612529_cov17-Prasinocladus_malaysianus.AAC.1